MMANTDENSTTISKLLSPQQASLQDIPQSLQSYAVPKKICHLLRKLVPLPLILSWGRISPLLS